MSIATLVIGESGTGKSTALRNLDPTSTLLIQIIKKPLPFRVKGWAAFNAEAKTGNIVHSDQHAEIVKWLGRASRSERMKVVVIDDFQYLMGNEFMRRSDEKGYEKFTEIGRHAWDVLTAATQQRDDLRVYILSHTEVTDAGRTKLKTIGKMLDDKITLEGMVTTVLRTDVSDGVYSFATRNSGRDTVKSPMGLFADEKIDNDLALVDAALVEFYGLQPVAA